MTTVLSLINPEGLTKHQRAFADGLLSGLAPSDAYLGAGYKAGRTAAQTASRASRLASNPRIMQYVAARADAVREEEVLSAAQRRNLVLTGLVNEAKDKKNPAATRVKALELLGKTHDVRLFTDAVDAAEAVRTPREIRAELARRLSGRLPEEKINEIIDITPTE